MYLAKTPKPGPMILAIGTLRHRCPSGHCPGASLEQMIVTLDGSG